MYFAYVWSKCMKKELSTNQAFTVLLFNHYNTLISTFRYINKNVRQLVFHNNTFQWKKKLIFIDIWHWSWFVDISETLVYLKWSPKFFFYIEGYWKKNMRNKSKFRVFILKILCIRCNVYPSNDLKINFDRKYSNKWISKKK